MGKNRDTGFALACWILVALILLVFFFVKKDTIVSNLRHTNFVNRVTGKAAGEAEAAENTADSQSEDTLPLSLEESEASSDETEIAVSAEPSLPPPPVPNTTEAKEVRPMKKPLLEEEKESAPPAMMRVALCFVTIDSDGTVSRRITERELPKTSSPLTASINALLQGPQGEVLNGKTPETLIPEGTRLLGAEVRGGVATLNFSEEFAFNPVGVEGYMAQLMQVVYTATAFSTVNSVQFVINGQRTDYLGSEGEWIGSPLSRASFH